MSMDSSTHYANYGSRAVAYIIDFLILWGVALTSLIAGIAMLFSEVSRSIGIILLIAGLIWIPAGAIWNHIIRQGSSGQTLGKSRVNVKLVRVDTGRPIGVGLAIIRVLAGWIFNSITGGLFLIVDLLFPAFDKRHQRIIDKMLNTVVIDISRPPISSLLDPPTDPGPMSLSIPSSDPFA